MPWSVKNPPTIGPTTDASPNTPPNRPWYLPRSEAGIMSAMTANALENSAPPPRPWIALKTISWIIPPPSSGRLPNSPASPLSIEPARNRPTPKSRMGLRPKRSESLP